MRTRILISLATFSLAALAACGGGSEGSGGGGSTNHQAVVTGVSLPSDPAALEAVISWGQVGDISHQHVFDCFAGGTLQLYGIDVANHEGATSTATDATTTLQWTSSDPNVATVSGGLVACKTQGATQITATLQGESCNVSCVSPPFPVTVGTEKHTVTLSPNPVSLTSGQSQAMIVTLTTETVAGSTDADVTATVFEPSNSYLNVAVTGSTEPVDFTNSNLNHDGNLVAGTPGSALIWVEYTVPGTNTTYSSNLVSFTSR